MSELSFLNGLYSDIQIYLHFQEAILLAILESLNSICNLHEVWLIIKVGEGYATQWKKNRCKYLSIGLTSDVTLSMEKYTRISLSKSLIQRIKNLCVLLDANNQVSPYQVCKSKTLLSILSKCFFIEFFHNILTVPRKMMSSPL